MEVTRQEAPPPEPPPPPEPTYTITMSESEVVSLLKVIGCIGGKDRYPEGNVTDHLYLKLQQLTGYNNYSPFEGVNMVRHDGPGQGACSKK